MISWLKKLKSKSSPASPQSRDKKVPIITVLERPETKKENHAVPKTHGKGKEGVNGKKEAKEKEASKYLPWYPNNYIYVLKIGNNICSTCKQYTEIERALYRSTSPSGHPTLMDTIRYAGTGANPLCFRTVPLECNDRVVELLGYRKVAGRGKKGKTDGRPWKLVLEERKETLKCGGLGGRCGKSTVWSSRAVRFEGEEGLTWELKKPLVPF